MKKTKTIGLMFAGVTALGAIGLVLSIVLMWISPDTNDIGQRLKSLESIQVYSAMVSIWCLIASGVFMFEREWDKDDN